MTKFLLFDLLQVAVIFSFLHLITADGIGISGKNVSLPFYNSTKNENWNPSSLLEVQIDSPKQNKRLCMFTWSSKKGVCEKDSDRYELTGDGNFTIIDVRLEDEGTYTFTINKISLIHYLTVYVAPSISVKKIVNPLRAGSGFVEAAWCTVSGGKPEASVKWMTDGPMEFNETLHGVNDADQNKGLPTVRKGLDVQPTRCYNGQSFFCKVKHPTLENTEVRNLTLNVTYPPSPARISPTADKKRLICTSEGNPPPMFTWTMPSISHLPTIPGDTADLISPQDPARHNDTYICVASNGILPDQTARITTNEARDTVDLISPQDPARHNDTYICVASNGILPDQTARMTTNEAVSDVAITSSQNVGGIVGVVIGGLLLLAIICCPVCMWPKWRNKRTNKDRSYLYSPPKQQTKELL